MFQSKKGVTWPMREIRLIDRGGFGVVHEVEAKGSRLAKKSFDPMASDTEEREKLRKRFVREVRVQSQIHHPNIMPIVEFDLDATKPWFTMPLAAESFEKKIKRDRNVGTVDAGAWQDILAAVEELHRLGYVHRDLKPANVLDGLRRTLHGRLYGVLDASLGGPD